MLSGVVYGLATALAVMAFIQISENTSPPSQKMPETIDIDVKIDNVHGNVTYFQLKGNTSLQTLMSTYCSGNESDFKLVRFIFDSNDNAQSTSESTSTDNSNVERINVQLRMAGVNNSRAVNYEIRKNIPLRVLLTPFSDRMGLSPQVMRLRFDGNPISDTETAETIDVKNGDTIYGFQVTTAQNSTNGA